MFREFQSFVCERVVVLYYAGTTCLGAKKISRQTFIVLSIHFNTRL